MRIVTGLLACSFVVGLGTGAFAQDPKVQQGMKVFADQKCSMCHSVEGKGNKKFPLDGVGKKLSAADIKEWIVDPRAAEKKHGSTAKPPMKAYANLSAADLEALVAYLASLK
jgi:mono/diheme cytochrome c family protein